MRTLVIFHYFLRLLNKYNSSRSHSPYNYRYYRGSATEYQLDTSPVEFEIEETGWKCRLSYNVIDGGTIHHRGHLGNYLLWINDTLVQDLEKAVIQKPVPPTSRSEVLSINKDDYRSVLTKILSSHSVK